MADKICRNWSETGTCRFGNNCKFTHPPKAGFTANQKPAPKPAPVQDTAQTSKTEPATSTEAPKSPWGGAHPGFGIAKQPEPQPKPTSQRGGGNPKGQRGGPKPTQNPPAAHPPAQAPTEPKPAEAKPVTQEPKPNPWGPKPTQQPAPKPAEQTAPPTQKQTPPQKNTPPQQKSAQPKPAQSQPAPPQETPAAEPTQPAKPVWGGKHPSLGQQQAPAPNQAKPGQPQKNNPQQKPTRHAPSQEQPKPAAEAPKPAWGGQLGGAPANAAPQQNQQKPPNQGGPQKPNQGGAPQNQQRGGPAPRPNPQQNQGGPQKPPNQGGPPQKSGPNPGAQHTNPKPVGDDEPFQPMSRAETWSQNPLIKNRRRGFVIPAPATPIPIKITAGEPILLPEIWQQIGLWLLIAPRSIRDLISLSECTRYLNEVMQNHCNVIWEQFYRRDFAGDFEPTNIDEYWAGWPEVCHPSSKKKKNRLPLLLNDLSRLTWKPPFAKCH